MNPSVRFRANTGCSYPPLTKATLGDISSFRRGSFPQPYGLKKWYDHINGAPFIQVFDIDDNFKLKAKTQRLISKAAQEQSVFVKKGSLLVTIQGSIGRVAVTQYDAYVDRTLLLFESFNIPINPIYFSYILFNLFEVEKKKAPGGIIKTITKEVLTKFSVYLCTIEEQNKIASFLSAIDQKISLLTQKHELLTTYKKGVMQKIFNQEIRFKDDAGRDYPDWTRTSLSKIASFIKDGTHGTHSDDIDGEYYLLSAKNILDGKVVYGDSDRKISESEFQSIHKNYSLEEGDILLSVVGTIGRVAVYTTEYKKMAFQRSVAFFRFPSQSSIFMEQLFLSSKFQKSLSIYQVMSAQAGVYLGDLGKINVDLPCFDEQIKIGKYLAAIDKKLSLIKSQLNLTMQYRQGLLQQMFI